MFFFINGLKALYTNTGCLKCISDMTLSLANNYCIHLLYSRNEISLNNGVLDLNWTKNLLASLSLTNLDFLLFHTAHFNKSVIFALLALSLFHSNYRYSFYTSRNLITLSYNFVRFYILLLSFRLFLSFCWGISLIPILLPCSINLRLSMYPSWLSFALLSVFKIILFLMNH